MTPAASPSCMICGCPLTTLLGDRPRRRCVRHRTARPFKTCIAPGCDRRVHGPSAPTCLAHRKGWNPCEVPSCRHTVGPRQTGNRCRHHALTCRLHVIDMKPGTRVNALRLQEAA